MQVVDGTGQPAVRLLDDPMLIGDLAIDVLQAAAQFRDVLAALQSPASKRSSALRASMSR